MKTDKFGTTETTNLRQKRTTYKIYLDQKNEKIKKTRYSYVLRMQHG